MCGLVGGTGLSGSKEYEALTILMLNNVLRGTDSTGVFYTYKDNHNKNWYNTKKSMLPSSSFISTSDWERIMNERPVCVAGHARAATKGKVEEKNAHPFEVGDRIIGMHNGTIHGKFEGSEDFETDSEAMFNLIHKKGLNPALTEMYDAVNTMAYAIVMYDNKEGRVNIIRNYARPLSIARHKTNKAKMFWASEKSFLLFALLRAGIISEFEIEELKTHSLVSFNPYILWAKEDEPKYCITVEEDWFKVPVKPVVEYKTPALSSYAWTGNTRHFSQSNSLFDTEGEYDGMPPRETSSTNKDIVGLANRLEKSGVPSVFKIGNKYETLQEFLHTIQCGCQVCGDPSTVVNNNWKKFKFEYGKPKDYICDSCTDKYNDDLLACEYGLVNLVHAENAEKA